MTSEQLTQFIITWLSDPGHVALVFLFLARMLVNGTDTPDPSTPKGKLYKLLEWIALNFGKAKQTGQVPPQP